MAKQKSFQDKLMQKIKRECPVPWSRDFLQPAGAPLDASSFNPAGAAKPLLDTRFMTLQEEADLFAMVLGGYSSLSNLDRIVYPGLMVSWMIRPVTIDLSARFAKRMLENPDLGLNCPWERLKELFPSCLLVDTRSLGVELYGLKMDALFMYPSFDEDRQYGMVLMVGVDSRVGLSDPLLSKLVLKGETFQDALDASLDERKILHLRWLTGLDTGDHDQIFASYEDETVIQRLGCHILAQACCDQGTITWLSTGERAHAVFDVFQAKCPTAQDNGLSLNVPFDSEDLGPEFIVSVDRSEGDPVLAADNAMDDAAMVNDSMAAAVSAVTTDCDELPDDDALGEEATLDDVGALDSGESGFALFNLLEQEKREVQRLTQANAALSFHLSQAQESAETSKARMRAMEATCKFVSQLEIPQDALAALDMAVGAFGDKLAVLPQARKSAQEFVKGDVSEVWRVLRDMAVVLHPLIFEGESHDIARAYTSQTGYELALRDRKAANSDPVRKRLLQVSYNGQNHDLTPHVKGKGVKRGESLRVHFFADYDSQKLVIGHCGEHLETPLTAHI